MGWEISKEFACCYGHRVHNQKLNQKFSIDNACVCRHLHGHQMKLLVHLRGKHLNDGMVTDFKHLNWFKKFIDDVVDHKFIVDMNDPLFPVLFPDFQEGPLKDLAFVKHRIGSGDITKAVGEIYYWTLNPQAYKDFAPELVEMYEGYVVVPFVPTSEHLSKWFYDIVSDRMKELCEVSRVEFYETPKSRSQYTG